MIIQNGYIRFRYKTNTGLDPTTGYPRTPNAGWGPRIPCQWYTTSQRIQATTPYNDHHTAITYTILIDQQLQLPSEQIELSDRSWNTLGTFSIQSIVQLDAVCQTQLTTA